MAAMIRILGLFLLLLSSVAYAAEDLSEKPTETSLWTQTTQHLGQIWDEGDIELLLPIHTWHNRMSYSSEKIRKYNENPWGFGIGKYIDPVSNRRYGIAALTFQDSFNKPEPTLWYSWQALYREGKDFRPSCGFVAGLTFRDNYHWLPVPGAAPTVGFDYKNFSLEALYIIGFDVVFTWATWRF